MLTITELKAEEHKIIRESTLSNRSTQAQPGEAFNHPFKKWTLWSQREREAERKIESERERDRQKTGRLAADQ